MYYLFYSYLTRQLNPACLSCKDLIHSGRAEFLDDPATALIAKKDRGGLIYPSKWMIKVVKTAESAFRIIMNDEMACKKSEAHLLKVVREVMGDPPITHIQHANETQHGITNHISAMLDTVVAKFHTLRIHERARKVNRETHKSLIRHKNTKLIIFSGQ